jgi:hypothetical protein
MFPKNHIKAAHGLTIYFLRDVKFACLPAIQSLPTLSSTTHLLSDISQDPSAIKFTFALISTVVAKDSTAPQTLNVGQLVGLVSSMSSVITK